MVKTLPQPGDVIVAPAIVDTYAALNIIGICLLLLLSLTIIFSPRTRLHRDPTLINAFFVLIWVNTWNVIYYCGVGGDIGVWESRTRPKFGLCKVQAVVLAGSQPAQAAAVFALCLRLWIKTIELSVPWFRKLKSNYILIGLLALPHLCWIAFIPAMAKIVQRKDDETIISPTPFYCSTLEDEIRWGSQSLALAFSALSLLIELHLIYLVARQFSHTSQAAVRASATLSQSMGIDASLAPERSIKRFFYVRVGVFICWTLVMLAATLYQAFTASELDPYADMLFACVSPLAFLCFATQPDVMRTWRIPSSIEEWKALFRGHGISPSRRVSSETIKLTGELAWADFLGSTSPDTIHSIDSKLSEREEKGRMEHDGNMPVYLLGRNTEPLYRLEEEQDRGGRGSGSLVVCFEQEGRTAGAAASETDTKV